MKILLKGYYGFGNLGDDILLKVAFNCLLKKYAIQEIEIFSNYTENLNDFEKTPGYNHYIFKLLGANPVLIDWTHRAAYDLIIDGGGGIYFGHAAGKLHHAIINFVARKIGAINTYRLDEFLRKISNRNRRLLYKQRIGIGIGVGEYSETFSQLFNQFSDIGSYTHLFVRDEESKVFLGKYGLRKNVQVYSDLAFLSNYWWSPGQQSDHKLPEKSIAIVLLDFKENTDVNFDQIISFEEHAIKKGYTITYFSIDDVKDKAFRQRFKHRSLICWQPNNMSLSDFLGLLRKNSIVISARAHGAILGACMGMVPIIIPHSQKLVQVAKMFPNASVQYSVCANDNLLSIVDYIFMNFEPCRLAVKQDVAMNRAKAEEMMEAFFKIV